MRRLRLRNDSSLTELGRAAVLSRKRPHPPRELRFSNGILSWKAPNDPSGITHYRVYAPDDVTLVRQVSVGQTYLQDNLSAPRVFVSSYSKPVDLESTRTPLLERVIRGGVLVEFIINGTVAVGEDLVPRPTPLPLTFFGDGWKAIPLEARVVVKTPGTGTDLIANFLYSNDVCIEDPSLREWFSVFRDLTQAEIDEAELDTDAYRLILPVGYDQLCAPITTMADPLPEFPAETIFALDVIQASTGLADATFGLTLGLFKAA